MENFQIFVPVQKINTSCASLVEGCIHFSNECWFAGWPCYGYHNWAQQNDLMKPRSEWVQPLTSPDSPLLTWGTAPGCLTREPLTHVFHGKQGRVESLFGDAWCFPWTVIRNPEQLDTSQIILAKCLKLSSMNQSLCPRNWLSAADRVTACVCVSPLLQITRFPFYYNFQYHFD